MKLVKLRLSDQSERLWALRVSKNSAKLISMPSYTQKMCCGDLVKFDNRHNITQVLERGARTRHGVFSFEGTHKEIQRRFDRIVGYLGQYDIVCQHQFELCFAMAVPADLSDEHLKWLCEESGVLLYVNDEQGKPQIVTDLPPAEWPLAEERRA